MRIVLIWLVALKMGHCPLMGSLRRGQEVFRWSKNGKRILQNSRNEAGMYMKTKEWCRSLACGVDATFKMCHHSRFARRTMDKKSFVGLEARAEFFKTEGTNRECI
jgi:hypothetical protein